MPLLGDTSLLAAKAALAAKRQGAYAAFQQSLSSSPFRANDAYLVSLAETVGLDHGRLITDMASPGITRELQTSAALSDLFRFVGTPALVVGRTVIQGQISEPVLRKVIAAERADGWRNVC